MPSLLDMPAEIRNAIYNYALSFPDGLEVQWCQVANRKKKRPVLVRRGSDNEALDANQLKLVSRQLFSESQGLEVMTSDIIFQGQSHSSPGAMYGFLDFMDAIESSRISWLSRLVLAELPDPSDTGCAKIGWFLYGSGMKSIYKTMQFCIKHPEVSVQMKMPYLEHLQRDRNQMMANGLLLLAVFRDVDLWEEAPMFRRVAGFSATMRAQKRMVLRGDYQNVAKMYGGEHQFRLVPASNGSHLDVDAMKDEWMKRRWFKQQKLGEEDLQKWVEMVVDWHENGF